MKKNPLFFLFAILVIASLALSACGGTQPADPAQPDQPADPAQPAQPADPAAETPGEKKIATLIWTQEPDYLNPMYTNMWFSTITQQIWNCQAWDWDEEANPRPVLVTEMPSLENGGISADGKTLTITLRDDIIWSDGTPITSADFLFTAEMFTAPSNTVHTTMPYDLFVDIQAPDERTVVITFDEPYVPWASSIYQEMLPKHVLQPVFDAEGTLDNAPWNMAPTVGCGPYVFAEWESGSFARFVRNDNYYNAPAKIDEVFMRFVPDDAAQVAALQTGAGDVGTFIATSDFETLEAAGVNVLMVPSGYNEGWFFYFGPDSHPAVSDVKVRQAVAMCFDRFSINEDLLLGLTVPAVTPWDDTPFANPAISAWPYDPARANTLLDEAGWVDSNGDGIRDKDGVELILRHGTTTRAIRQDSQAVAQQNLRECGIQLELISYPASTYFASYGEDGPKGTGQLDIFQHSSRTSFPDPNVTRMLCSEIPSDEKPDGLNDQHLCDERVDALLQLQRTQMDFNTRQQTVWELGELTLENVYWLGVWQDPDSFAVSNRLTNVKISGVTPLFNIAEWDIAP
jgi:peptide/nickel transport system substrate-binding protein